MCMDSSNLINTMYSDNQCLGDALVDTLFISGVSLGQIRTLDLLQSYLDIADRSIKAGPRTYIYRYDVYNPF